MKCLIIDPENDPAYLALALSFPSDQFNVIEWQDLKVAPFTAPAGVGPLEWRGRTIGNLREACFMRDGSTALANTTLDNIESMSPGQPIPVKLAHAKVMERKYQLGRQGREYGFFETFKNRLERLMASPIFDCAAGFEISDLISTNTLLRCRGMPEDDYVLVVNDLLLRLAAHFSPDHGSQAPRLIVVVEEVHKMVHRERLRRADISEPIMLDAVRRLAKCGVMLVFVDQVPSELPPQILANCGTRFVFSTIEGRDLDALQRSMSLTREQRAALSTLPRQVCVAQYQNPSFPEPFLVRIADGPSLAYDEADLSRRRTETLARLSYVPAEDLPKPAAVKQREKAALLSHMAADYLVEIGKDELEPVTWRDKRIKMPGASGNALRKELAEAGLIEFVNVNTRSRCRAVKLTMITERGREHLKSMKVSYDRPKGIGSLEHLYHQHSIAKWARRNGYHASVEHFVDGKSVDVSLEKDGVAIACEVLCSGVAKELNNLRDLQAGYSEIWFCVKNEDDGRRLRTAITTALGPGAEAVLAKVRFKMLREFQPEFGADDTPDMFEVRHSAAGTDTKPVVMGIADLFSVSRDAVGAEGLNPDKPTSPRPE